MHLLFELELIFGGPQSFLAGSQPWHCGILYQREDTSQKLLGSQLSRARPHLILMGRSSTTIPRLLLVLSYEIMLVEFNIQQLSILGIARLQGQRCEGRLRVWQLRGIEEYISSKFNLT
ncbi:hypothetical protein LINPERHAP1_LOCUS6402 [Linum perenne]